MDGQQGGLTYLILGSLWRSKCFKKIWLPASGAPMWEGSEVYQDGMDAFDRSNQYLKGCWNGKKGTLQKMLQESIFCHTWFYDTQCLFHLEHARAWGRMSFGPQNEVNFMQNLQKKWFPCWQIWYWRNNNKIVRYIVIGYWLLLTHCCESHRVDAVCSMPTWGGLDKTAQNRQSKGKTHVYSNIFLCALLVASTCNAYLFLQNGILSTGSAGWQVLLWDHISLALL